MSVVATLSGLQESSGLEGATNISRRGGPQRQPPVLPAATSPHLCCPIICMALWAAGGVEEELCGTCHAGLQCNCAGIRSDRIWKDIDHVRRQRNIWKQGTRYCQCLLQPDTAAQSWQQYIQVSASNNPGTICPWKIQQQCNPCRQRML